ncbi:30S ribosomal protein S15 [Candidatus Woesearchaeota archaeon]|nr:30S ribosomal protein S15 [Candidatus Woesearchaeota archaeon]MDP1693963.1 30S ribosomal protein S15 [Candidatus Woesearchaeota archaeon]
MARLYSRKKGKSGSKRPTVRVKPAWVTYDEKTVEQLVVKIAKTGKTASTIGIELRDTYGIPDVKAITKKPIGQILVEHKIISKLPDDLKALIRTDIALMKHMEINKKDMPGKRGLSLCASKIGRLVKYYKRTKVLPIDWKYDRTKAKILIEQ